MKRTPEDTEFAALFGRELKRKYDEAKRRGMTDAGFAESIGVVRAQLDKYVRGEAVPGIRTIALAKRKYGISVPYDGIVVSKTGRRRQRSGPSADQLELPFVIWAEGPGEFDLKLRPVSTRRFALDLVIKRKTG
jgi:hypothetical protein